MSEPSAEALAAARKHLEPLTWFRDLPDSDRQREHQLLATLLESYAAKLSLATSHAVHRLAEMRQENDAAEIKRLQRELAEARGRLGEAVRLLSRIPVEMLRQLTMITEVRAFLAAETPTPNEHVVGTWASYCACDACRAWRRNHPSTTLGESIEVAAPTEPDWKAEALAARRVFDNSQYISVGGGHIDYNRIRGENEARESATTAELVHAVGGANAELAQVVRYLTETLAGNHPHLREAYLHAAYQLNAGAHRIVGARESAAPPQGGPT